MLFNPRIQEFTRPVMVGLMAVTLTATLAVSAAGAADNVGGGTPEGAAGDSPTAAAESAETPSNRYVKEGVVVEFDVVPPAGSKPGYVPKEGDVVGMRFTLTEEATGEPVRGVIPGVWMDIANVLQGRPEAEQKSCKDKIALYLGGAVGIRPMVDLNSYYVVVMNREATISIIDPLVSMAGVTSTLAMLRLKAPGADWVKSSDERRLYITEPQAGMMAVVDTETFKVVTEVEAGSEPTRVAMQPDGRFLWVGNNAASEQDSGVTILDVETFERVAHITTGLGHHEIAFSDDSRYAFVSNRQSGTVSVIDVAARELLKQVPTGPLPISIAYSPLGQTLYVADGEEGTISIIDGRSFDVRKHIQLEPGLGPLRFTRDGQFALVVNPAADKVFVIDPATDETIHVIPVADKPYQLTVSRAFAYVRPLGSEQVSLINLGSLGQGKDPIVQRIAAGAAAPQLAGDLPLADSMATSTTEAAGFIVNPADNTTYFYMEGMNAPSSNYRVYGASARAVTVVDRSMRESEPGVYMAAVKVPTAGKFDVAFLLETPRLLHCFSMVAEQNPLIKHDVAALELEVLSKDRQVTVGEDVPFRFRLIDPTKGEPRSGLKDVQVLFFRVPAHDRTEVAAVEEGEGVYRAMLPLRNAGAYYVYVGVRSQHVSYQDLPFFTLVARQKSGPRDASPKPPAGEPG